jgi:hypothetical protein
MAKRNTGRQRRCVIVERHEWETGAGQRQLQFVLDPARDFFGRGDRARSIRVRVFLPPDAGEPAFEQDITISQEYRNGTRRTNGFPQMGSVPSSFVFFEETGEPDVYDVWWQEDKAIVAAMYTGWSQGLNTQYGRGRLSLVLAAPVPRVIDRIE